MTIGAIILDIVIAIAIMGIGILISSEECENVWKGVVITSLIAVIVLVITIIVQIWFYGNTASGARAIKSQKSELTNGLKRDVKVYSADGKLLQEYTGKFDVDYDNDRIVFDDEKGKRHTIYYPTGTVIIDEK